MSHPFTIQTERALLRIWNRLATIALLCSSSWMLGCGGRDAVTDDQPSASEFADTAPSNDQTVTTPSSRQAVNRGEVAPVEPREYELDAKKLLAARLDDQQARRGWVRLFDGSTLFGWQIAGDANWRIEDATIVVDAGEPSFLATSTVWDDYELELEFRVDTKTNSGVFLRTPLFPESPASDCYEVNIAPPDDPYPTGSLVQRGKATPEAVRAFQPDRWHRFRIRVQGAAVTVSLDDQQVLQYEDPVPLPPGRIALQHNQGKVAFRDIRVRPLGLQPLLDQSDLAQWKQYPDMDGEFTIDEEGLLSVRGGSGQLESRQSYGDFILHARCRTNSPDLNSGIFFRCIPGEKMNGYECQISNEMVADNPLKPADCGTGGIFRRQDARLVAGEDLQWVNILLVAYGPNFSAWVNGLQVSDWTDDRQPDPNPRRGLRLDPGTLMIQAHDPTTDLSFSDFRVRSYSSTTTTPP